MHMKSFFIVLSMMALHILPADSRVSDKASKEDRYMALCDTTGDGNLKQLESLLSEGFDPNDSGLLKVAESPLIIAVDSGRFDLAQLLLRHRANPNMARSYRSPLTAIILSNLDRKKNEKLSFSQRKEIVELLMSNGANINLVTSGCRTALQVAALHGDMEMVKLLISHGACNRILYKASARRESDQDSQTKDLIASVKTAIEKTSSNQDIVVKMQVVKEYLEKEMKDHEAMPDEEVACICVSDSVDALLRRDAFTLTPEQKEAFTQVSLHIEDWTFTNDSQGYPLDRKDFTDEQRERHQISTAYWQIYDYIGEVNGKHGFKLKPNKKIRLQAIKNYIEEETHDQEMLVLD